MVVRHDEGDGAVFGVLYGTPQVVADDALGEDEEGAKHHDHNQDCGIPWHIEPAKVFGSKQVRAKGKGENDAQHARPHEDSQGQVCDGEDAVEQVGELFPERPRALAFEPLAALIKNNFALVADPIELGDKRGVLLCQRDDGIAHCLVAGKDVHASLGNVWNHKLFVQSPVDRGKNV